MRGTYDVSMASTSLVLKTNAFVNLGRILKRDAVSGPVSDLRTLSLFFLDKNLRTVSGQNSKFIFPLKNKILSDSLICRPKS